LEVGELEVSNMTILLSIALTPFVADSGTHSTILASSFCVKIIQQKFMVIFICITKRIDQRQQMS